MSAAEVVSDPSLFADWWQNRGIKRFAARDNAIIQAAHAARLLTRAGDMLWLTAAGRDLREKGGKPA